MLSQEILNKLERILEGRKQIFEGTITTVNPPQAILSSNNRVVNVTALNNVSQGQDVIVFRDLDASVWYAFATTLTQATSLIGESTTTSTITRNQRRPRVVEEDIVGSYPFRQVYRSGDNFVYGGTEASPINFNETSFNALLGISFLNDSDVAFTYENNTDEFVLNDLTTATPIAGFDLMDDWRRYDFIEKRIIPNNVTINNPSPEVDPEDGWNYTGVDPWNSVMTLNTVRNVYPSVTNLDFGLGGDLTISHIGTDWYNFVVGTGGAIPITETQDIDIGSDNHCIDVKLERARNRSVVNGTTSINENHRRDTIFRGITEQTGGSVTLNALASGEESAPFDGGVTLRAAWDEDDITVNNRYVNTTTTIGNTQDYSRTEVIEEVGNRITTQLKTILSSPIPGGGFNNLFLWGRFNNFTVRRISFVYIRGIYGGFPIPFFHNIRKLPNPETIIPPPASFLAKLPAPTLAPDTTSNVTTTDTDTIIEKDLGVAYIDKNYTINYLSREEFRDNVKVTEGNGDFVFDSDQRERFEDYVTYLTSNDGTIAMFVKFDQINFTTLVLRSQRINGIVTIPIYNQTNVYNEPPEVELKLADNAVETNLDINSFIITTSEVDPFSGIGSYTFTVPNLLTFYKSITRLNYVSSRSGYSGATYAVSDNTHILNLWNGLVGTNIYYIRDGVTYAGTITNIGVTDSVGGSTGLINRSFNSVSVNLTSVASIACDLTNASNAPTIISTDNWNYFIATKVQKLTSFLKINDEYFVYVWDDKVWQDKDATRVVGFKLVGDKFELTSIPNREGYLIDNITDSDPQNFLTFYPI